MEKRHATTLISGLRQLLAFMSPKRKRQFYLVVLLMLLGALAELVTLGAVLPFLALISNPALANEIPVIGSVLQIWGIASTGGILAVAAGIFALAAAVAGAVRLILAWISQGFVFHFGHDVAVGIHRRILEQPYSYHVSQNTSVIISSLEKVQVLIFNVLLQMMLAATAVVISTFIIAAIVWIDHLTAAIAAVGFGLTYAVVTFMFRARLARNSATIGSAYAKRVQILQESLGGIRDIILDGSQSVYVDSFRETDKTFTDARASNAFLGAAPRFVIEAAGLIVIAALAVIIAAREGGVAQALPILGALALGGQRLLPLFQQIYHGWTSLVGNKAALDDVLDLLHLPIDRETNETISPLPLKEEIRLRDVKFCYPERAAAALDHINLVIPRGTWLALVGTTGSGKSTLVDLLMGLLEPTTGTIEIDGRPLTQARREKWRRNIAHVPQSIFLADATIAQNIAFGSTADEIDINRVIAVSRRAQLHQFIETLPQGYETSVGERGVRLSGGQRQRLGIARALYKHANVLVLDEATSALDDETEKAVIRSLHETSGDKLTVIMIAHRLSSIAGCDLVVRLENGRIVQSGSYAQIIGNAAA